MQTESSTQTTALRQYYQTMTRHHPLLTSLAGMEHFEFPVYHKGEGGKLHGRNRVLLECSMLLLFSLVTSLPFWPFFKVWLPSFLPF